LDSKQAVWAKLAGEWKLAGLDAICTEIGLEQLDTSLSSVLAGQATGRFLLNLHS
jgi:hypothetical protein